ncbi:NadC3 [Desulforapulum autotrophicum HRM2]|uniref:NadC3 n=1 Tax=Desulforapulum autotrophicum (strain ATCC 43914 / DSM 3382 / VKM B-1955 / HRM2) TaxID=177437 RepID=C0QAV5_DESAH|nr:SLC13 family permease [Desulforapulum autotrophicum]ACN16888.1 NadC3 [Desulforapulum autotrophicum HRM2]
MSSELNIAKLEEEGGAKQSQTFALKWIAISLIAGLLIWLIPTPADLGARGHAFLAMLTAVVILWTSEAIPIGVTSIGVGCAMIILKIQTSKAAWEPYANRTVVFVFFIIMLGVMLSQTTIPNRLMSYILKIGGTNVKRLSFTLCMGATFLAAWTHDATITIVLLYAMMPMFLKMGLTPDKSNNFTKHFMFIIPLGAACGGGATFLGSGRSPASAELLFKITGYNIGFMEYMLYQFVPSMFLGLATWLAVWIIYPPKVKVLPAELTIEKMPPMQKNEKQLSWILAVTFLLWFMTDITKIHVSAIGGLFIVVCMVFKVVDWKRCLDEYPWNPIMVFGAGFSLGVAMLDTGAGQWIATQIFPIFTNSPWPVVAAGASALSAVITSFMANAAATALLVPVVVPMADMAGTPVVPIAMAVPLATTFVLLVIGCPPTLIAYGFGYFTQWEACKILVFRSILGIIVLSLCMALWYPLMGMPGNTDNMKTPAKLTMSGYELIINK